MSENIKYNFDPDRIVSRFAAAYLSTGVNHPAKVVQVGDQVYATGVNNEKYGVGSLDIKLRSIEQLPAPAQDIVRRAVASSYALGTTDSAPGENVEKAMNKPKSATSSQPPVPTTHVPKDAWLSAAARQVARAIVEHAKGNINGVSASDAAKKSVHDVYAHFAQQNWTEVLNAARRYLRSMQGSSTSPTSATTTPATAPAPAVAKAFDSLREDMRKAFGIDPEEFDDKATLPVSVMSQFAEMHNRHVKSYVPELGSKMTHGSISVDRDRLGGIYLHSIAHGENGTSAHSYTIGSRSNEPFHYTRRVFRNGDDSPSGHEIYSTKLDSMSHMFHHMKLSHLPVDSAKKSFETLREDMQKALISRDPFAREEWHGHEVKPGKGETCKNCGNLNKHGNLKEFEIQTDGGSKRAVKGRFCGVNCMRDYHGI